MRDVYFLLSFCRLINFPRNVCFVFTDKTFWLGPSTPATSSLNKSSNASPSKSRRKTKLKPDLKLKCGACGNVGHMRYVRVFFTEILIVIIFVLCLEPIKLALCIRTVGDRMPP